MHPRHKWIMHPRHRGWEELIFLLSLLLAAVFIYAGISKFRDPLQFADSIAAFAILPATLIKLVALIFHRLRWYAGCS
jgi:uncharacterized membrane protein YphA (DoxX/SURF4 family)